MRKQCSDAFIEQALIKVYSRGEERTIRDVASDINVSYVTFKIVIQPPCPPGIGGHVASE